MPRPGSPSCVRKEFLWSVLLCCGASLPATAGPPLFSDDPQTVGRGNVELIVASVAFGISENIQLSAPVVDLTLGLLPALDFALVLNPIFEFGPEERLPTEGAMTLALKWQPIRGEHWNAAFTPAVSLDFPAEAETTVFLPVQVEYRWSRFAVGGDGGWSIVSNARDLWQAALYGSYRASDDWVLVGEVFAFRSPADSRTKLGMSFGFDWRTPLGIHLLAAAGPGIPTSGGDRLKWRAYLGTQWNFSLGSWH